MSKYIANPSETPPDGSAPARLRQLMSNAFSLSDIKTLCFDLGVDFETLNGEDKSEKIVSLIQHCSRVEMVPALVEACRKNRPGSIWSDMAAAAGQPGEFVFDMALDHPSPAPVAPKSWLNLPADRAAKVGFASGILALLLVFCGFSGGLLARDLVDITIKPVQPNRAALAVTQFHIGAASFTPASTGRTFAQVLAALASGALSPGTLVETRLDNVQATTFLDDLIANTPNAPVHDVHARFLASGEGLLNFSRGSLRYVVAYTASSDGKNVFITPTRAVIQIGNGDGLFGWLRVPAAVAQPFTNWVERQLNDASSRLLVRALAIQENALVLRLETR